MIGVNHGVCQVCDIPHLANSAFSELVNRTVAAHLVAKGPQGDVGKALLRQAKEFGMTRNVRTRLAIC